MVKNLPLYLKYVATTMLLLVFFCESYTQTELAPWGNLTGIRVDGQLMEFETNLNVVQKNWNIIKSTGKERQRPMYVRNGNEQVVTTTIDSVNFKESVSDAGKGSAHVTVELTAKGDQAMDGVYLGLLLPDEFDAATTIQINQQKPVPFSLSSSALEQYLQTAATSLVLVSPNRQLTITFEKPSIIITGKETKRNKGRLYIPLHTGNIEKGQIITTVFNIKASGKVDRKPINLVLNTKATGRVFDGLGGNFRLQNLKTDPQVIDYCLENLRVAWGRVEMPWWFWQPAIDTNPIVSAKAGKLNIRVQRAMEMAQRLYKLGMPVILSAWSAPPWAIVGAPKFRPGPDGVWGNPLDHSKDNEIYKSIADYVQYLKDEYGVEVAMFSFNESDLGINIRQTGKEHAAFIKGLGAYFVSRGLKTKLLLGDNSDATTYTFIDPALNDPETHPFIGAISFHSWRGWETATLQKWADAATRLKVPLLVGEGSIDAQAWGYPAIFEEQTYALEEINLYTRLLAICQPASILQWQLTADYSPLSGGGIFGDNGPLRPTQRFWNLKQLASPPEGLNAMPIQTSSANISAAALGDNVKNIYTIHLVNNGAARQVILTGLPSKLKAFKIFVTDKKRAMQEGKIIKVVDGKATFMLDETCYATLISN
ncbi:hypothetical protein BH11BAC3_BH11BAC3_09110 [soil metagenome]